MLTGSLASEDDTEPPERGKSNGTYAEPAFKKSLIFSGSKRDSDELLLPLLINLRSSFDEFNEESENFQLESLEDL